MGTAWTALLPLGTLMQRLHATSVLAVVRPRQRFLDQVAGQELQPDAVGCPARTGALRKGSGEGQVAKQAMCHF
ncbi:hypothetical protein XarjCFBP7653_13355 [Xanthomonas arboricola]|nr:hypothetical protein XarjCFBP7653_13355 [Xanthomonas arboricola]